MKRKRVVVMENERLLGAGVSSLLSGQQNLEVRKALFEDEGFVQSVSLFEPEVIVVDEETLAQNLSACSRLCQALPDLRLIVLHSETNTLKVFQWQMVLVRTVDDFLELM